MPEIAALLLTDIVDSAALAQRLGDAPMARLWAAHDRLARELLRAWRGREIDKTDGFLLLFADARDALGYALAYHRALATLDVPLKARAGLHVGEVTMRETPAADVLLGAKPVEVDGVSKPIAARVMSTALGGQTLITAATRDALGAVPQRVLSHGHWRVKGLPMPLELLEVGDDDAPFTPPPDADKVYRVVKKGELWLPARELRHSLPAERDAFVGRRSTLLDLARRFENGARLVSLLGIGGGGKTRLATRFGWVWMGDYPGGVWFCDLAPARTVEGLYSAVAQGLQLPLGVEDPLDRIGRAIAGRGACLVILDNFEQLARHAETTLGRWLDMAAEARFLVTTREVLGIPGEETLALAPLQAADAEALFRRRAAAAKRDFDPGPEDEAAIAPLVKLLDGLPLAIELAAARVRMLPPKALLARMSERFKLLASGGGRLDRQSTLRAAFDWSWDLLTVAEKVALAQLSVFEGGFTLAAAEAVLDLSALDDAPWTVDVLSSLVDKSFVRPLADERFDLLVSVQAYAAEHLQTDGRYPGSGAAALAAAQLRHADWFAALGPAGATQGACADLDNLVVACRRAVLAGRAEQAAGALDGAWAALSLRGPFAAGVDLADPVCALPDLSGHAAARAHAARGFALEASGRRAEASAELDTALALARSASDKPCEAAVLVRQGGLYARQGQAQAARGAHTQALTLARSLEDGSLACAALNGLGTVDFEQGQMEPARQHWEAALAEAKRTADRRWQGHLLGNLGNLQASLGRMDEAHRLCTDALQIARALGDRQREGNTLCNLGMQHLLQGRLDEAAGALQAALHVARELGHQRLECTAQNNLGLVCMGLSRFGDAVLHHEAALRVADGMGDRRMQGQFLGHLGLAQARGGAFDAARHSLRRGLDLLRATADPMSLALLLCQQAECAWLAADSTAAVQAWHEAQTLARQVGAGAESELELALARLTGLLHAAAPTG